MLRSITFLPSQQVLAAPRLGFRQPHWSVQNLVSVAQHLVQAYPWHPKPRKDNAGKLTWLMVKKTAGRQGHKQERQIWAARMVVFTPASNDRPHWFTHKGLFASSLMATLSLP